MSSTVNVGFLNLDLMAKVTVTNSYMKELEAQYAAVAFVTGQSRLYLQDTKFSNNRAILGHIIDAQNAASIHLERCRFIGNMANQNEVNLERTTFGSIVNTSFE
jgi:hypothetical protein